MEVSRPLTISHPGRSVMIVRRIEQLSHINVTDLFRLKSCRFRIGMT